MTPMPPCWDCPARCAKPPSSRAPAEVTDVHDGHTHGPILTGVEELLLVVRRLDADAFAGVFRKQLSDADLMKIVSALPKDRLSRLAAYARGAQRAPYAAGEPARSADGGGNPHRAQARRYEPVGASQGPGYPPTQREPMGAWPDRIDRATDNRAIACPAGIGRHAQGSSGPLRCWGGGQPARSVGAGLAAQPSPMTGRRGNGLPRGRPPRGGRGWQQGNPSSLAVGPAPIH